VRLPPPVYPSPCVAGGDGAGVGKGREISAIIVENLRRQAVEVAKADAAAGGSGGSSAAAAGGTKNALSLLGKSYASSSSSSSAASATASVIATRGRVHVWFSLNKDLAVDAARDLRDIGAAGVPVIRLGDVSGALCVCREMRGGVGERADAAAAAEGRIALPDVMSEWSPRHHTASVRTPSPPL
jgi:hypothetical protein